MKKFSYAVLIFLLTALMPLAVSGQAKVQFIHNSGDVSIDSFDIYINKTLVLNDFKFRHSSEFINGPSGIPLLIDICAATSTSPDNPLFSTAVQLQSGKKYIAIASGTLDGNGYNPYIPFELKVIDYARETASATGKTDILFHHGSTDAPVVDIVNKATQVILADDLGYGDFDGYYSYDPANYTVEVKDSATQEKLFTLELNLADLSNQAGMVIASGFANPSANNGGKSLEFFIALAQGGPFITMPLVPDPVAQLQIIHNSADLGINEVDIWINDKRYTSNFPFRTALPFTEVPAELPQTIHVLAKGSTSNANPLASLTATFVNQQHYILIIGGISSGTGYNPSLPLTLFKKDEARTLAANSSQTDMLVFHGSTDAPTIDLFETGVGIGQLVDNLSYGNYNAGGYLVLNTADYIFEVRNQEGTNTLFTYSAPLSALGFHGKAVTLLASGFLTPQNNSNGPAFGLYVAKPEGGPLFQLPVYTPPSTAFVQFIHASADTSVASVDIWMNNDIIVDNFTYKRASPYLELPAGQSIRVSILPSKSTSSANPLTFTDLTLTPGKRHILTFEGIHSTTGYSPLTPLALTLLENSRTVALNGSNVDILFHHSSTDAPEYYIYEFSTGLIHPALGYGDYSPYIETPLSDMGLHLMTGAQIARSYLAPFESLGLGGQASILMVSGFRNPAQNSNGDPLMMYRVPATGGGFVALEEVTGTPEKSIATFTIYPNPAIETVHIRPDKGFSRQTTIELYNLTGQRLLVSEVRASGEDHHTIDVSNLDAGLYLIRVTNDGQSVTHKLNITK